MIMGTIGGDVVPSIGLIVLSNILKPIPSSKLEEEQGVGMVVVMVRPRIPFRGK